MVFVTPIYLLMNKDLYACSKKTFEGKINESVKLHIYPIYVLFLMY
jgi:hypothetical protein